MSFALTQKIIRTDLGLSPSEKLAMITLADRVDAKGYCFPSNKTIAMEVGIGVRGIQKVIKKLEDKGMIRTKKRTGQSSFYFINEGRVSNMGYEPQGTPSRTVGHPTPEPQFTLIDNRTDKLIDKVEAGDPLNKPTSIKIVGEKMKVLDSIKTAVDGTGLKQSKYQNPKTVWVRAVSAWRMEQEISGKRNLITLTKVDVGKLNQVATKLGKPYTDIVTLCVEHWEEFVDYVESATGKDWLPEQPSIDFFIKNVSLADTFDITKKPKIDIKCNNYDILD